MRYGAQAQRLLLCAAHKARRMGHSYVGSAHLLLSILDGTDMCAQLLRGAGVNAELTADMTSVLCGLGTPGLPLPQGFTSHLRRILRGAAQEAEQLGSKQVDVVHIFLSMLRCERTSAKDLLVLNGVDTQELFSRTVEYLSWYQPAPKGKKEAVTTKLLEQFSEDLLQKAATMDPVIGRHKEIETVIGILCRKNKNNPALIGEPGVGKTAIAEGLAQRMA